MKIVKSPFLTGLFALLLSFSVFAADKNSGSLTVAVYDFTDVEKNSGSYGSKAAALVTANLAAETNLVMVERSDLNKALGEQAMGISGMVNSEQAAKIGQITGAKVLVFGQVMRAEKGRLVIVANIVGTETGRLFAEKAEGTQENFTDLTSELSRKIAQNIDEHALTFFVKGRSHEEYLDRIAKGVTGTNRPTVSIEIHWPQGLKHQCTVAVTEMGVILQKAGFTVVDENSERKPDVQIMGAIEADAGPRRSHLFSSHVMLDTKVQNRQTGKIILFDRQAADAVDIGESSARKAAAVNAVDGIAERVLPLLAQ